MHMEKLLHFVWMKRAFPQESLRTVCGKTVEVLDVGLHNHDAGPDFFNAKLKVDGQVWAGNVEVHLKASDWYRHHHEADSAYNNVILHVVNQNDSPAANAQGEEILTVVLPIPRLIEENFHELMTEELYPPCYRVIPTIPSETASAWLHTLTLQRLEEKARRILQWLHRSTGDWQLACFATLARNFGFGINSEAMETWAAHIPLISAGKHRDNLLQIEALFLGQAGLLHEEMVSEERRDDYYMALAREYAFLANKFSLRPMNPKLWRFLRLRPHNFPHVRLAQLARLFHEGAIDFSKIIETEDVATLRKNFARGVSPYWETHFSFGHESSRDAKVLSAASANLLMVNTAAPLLYVVGKNRNDDALKNRALSILKELPAESNKIVRSWKAAGLTALHAADSQALIHLRKNFCDHRDCLRCRFGKLYLGKQRD